MKKAAYITVLKDGKEIRDIQKVSKYCREHGMELEHVVMADMKKILFNPEEIAEGIRKKGYDIAVCDDIDICASSILGMNKTIVGEFQKAGITLIDMNTNLEMKDVIGIINSRLSEQAMKEPANAKGLILYKGDPNADLGQPFEEMKEEIGRYLGSGNTFGALIYQKEEPQLFENLNDFIERNPVEVVMLNEELTSIEGMDFTEKLQEKGIECVYQNEIVQEAAVWQMS